MTSIERARREVQTLIEAACASADTDRRRSFWSFERELWTRLLAVGRAMVALFLIRQASRPRAAEYVHGGRRLVLSGERTSLIASRFGKVTFARTVGRPVGHSRDACDLPVDRELGLCSGFSLGVLLGLTRLCAQMAFATARATYRDTYEWSPSPRATLRMVDAVGEEARAFLEQAPPPADDGEVLVLQVDGRGAPMITESEFAKRRRPHRSETGCRRRIRRRRRAANPRKRRLKGDKSKNAKVAIVGVIYTLRQTPDGLDGPIAKRVYATFESHEALFVWLHREAVKRGYGRKRTAFLADGSLNIWPLQKRYFPDAEVCLDWCHVVEKLWTAGECLLDEGSKDLEDWIALQTKRLRRGATRAILATLHLERDAIPRTGPGNRGRRQRLEDIIKFFENQRHRMRYPQMRRADLDIGTGAAEGAVRNLIAVRLDGPGMRWGRQRAERVLHLRCVLINGMWDEFVEYLGGRGQVALAAQPVPAKPHSASLRQVA